MAVLAYIGFGSNLGDRYATWENTLHALRHVAGIQVIRTAQPIETDPVGPILDQPRYLNSVIAIETTLEPMVLLAQLLSIEHQLGRVRRERWGPRTVDLDILLYGEQTIDHPQLQVPHPELKNRSFFVNALKELGCELSLSCHPGHGIRGGEPCLHSSVNVNVDPGLRQSETNTL